MYENITEQGKNAGGQQGGRRAGLLEKVMYKQGLEGGEEFLTSRRLPRGGNS